MYDVVEVNGRKGIVYERLEGPLLSQTLVDHYQDILEYGRRLAELQASIHQRRIAGLPSLHEATRRSIEQAPLLTPVLKSGAISVLERLPEGDAVCHMDMNVNNVIIAPRGWVAIDWDNVKSGNPLADIARAVLMLDAGASHAETPEEREAFAAYEPIGRDAYLRRYLELRPGTRKEINAWKVPLAAARLREDIAVEQEWLLSAVKEGLK